MNDYSEDLAELILTVMRDEAARLNGVFAIEDHKTGNISEELRASVKHGGKTFRVTMSYVRKDAIQAGQFPTGWAYIETDWDLRIRHRQDSFGNLQHNWYCEYHPGSGDPLTPPASHGRLVDENWLRELIRQKLQPPLRP